MKPRSIVVAVTIAMATSMAASAASAQVIYTRKTVQGAGYLGIRYDETIERSGNQTRERILVREISKDSPADKAGVETGDEILRINGLVTGNGKFNAIARTLVAGDTVRLRIKRNGSERDFTIVAAARPAALGAAAGHREIIISGDSIRGLMRRYLDSARVRLDSLHLPSGSIRFFRDDSSGFNVREVPYGNLMRDSLIWNHRDSTLMQLFKFAPGEGLRALRRTFELEGELGPGAIFHSFDLGSRSIGGAEFNEMTAEMAQYFNGHRGLLTLRVVPETPADRAGLQSGDVILKAKDRATRTISDLRAIIAANPDGVKLEISRKGTSQTLEFQAKR